MITDIYGVVPSKIIVVDVQRIHAVRVMAYNLTNWGRATHICVRKLTIIASDNGLSPGRREAIIWNNARILSIGLLGTNFSQILNEILIFFFKKMRLKMSSAKSRLLRLGLNELTQRGRGKIAAML